MHVEHIVQVLCPGDDAGACWHVVLDSSSHPLFWPDWRAGLTVVRHHHQAGDLMFLDGFVAT
jgi:hypothetical protein